MDNQLQVKNTKYIWGLHSLNKTDITTTVPALADMSESLFIDHINDLLLAQKLLPPVPIITSPDLKGFCGLLLSLCVQSLSCHLPNLKQTCVPVYKPSWMPFIKTKNCDKSFLKSTLLKQPIEIKV